MLLFPLKADTLDPTAAHALFATGLLVLLPRVVLAMQVVEAEAEAALLLLMVVVLAPIMVF